MKVFIYTLGCRVNQSESMMIADGLERLGAEVAKEPGGADLMVVNSCALTEFAEAKTRRAIRDFKKKNPNSKICATGCYAQTNAEALRECGVGLIVSNARKKDLPRLALDFLKGGNLGGLQTLSSHCAEAKMLSAIGYDFGDLGFAGDAPVSDRVNLKIQDGCDNACAYCIIPRARGLPRSRSAKEIVADAKNLASRGVAEIVLTGINLSKFGASLADLIDGLNEIKGLKRIGLGSIEPPVKELEKL
ncbi:MAG: radical SAM protein, partial [Opitutales bacterium]|nr:radical SAM protein [Opitutales bacterium]